MIAISFWELQSARRLFLCWKRHRLSIALTALAHWCGHSLKHCFLRWNADAHREKNNAANRPVPGDLAFGGGVQRPAPALHMRDGDGQSLRRSFAFPFTCPALASLILSPRMKMREAPHSPTVSSLLEPLLTEGAVRQFRTHPNGSPRSRSAGGLASSLGERSHKPRAGAPKALLEARSATNAARTLELAHSKLPGCWPPHQGA